MTTAGATAVACVYLRFSAAGNQGRRTGRHGNHVRDNGQLVLVRSRRRYSVPRRCGLVVRRRDDHRWPEVDTGGQRAGHDPDWPRRPVQISSAAPRPGDAVSVSSGH